MIAPTTTFPLRLAEADRECVTRDPCNSVPELTRLLVKADEEAYRIFFAQYARRLLLYHLALTNGDEEAAKELLQQTMIRVAKYIRVFESEEMLWSWLTTVARTCWIDEHRKKQRYGSLLDLFRRDRGDIPVPPNDAANGEFLGRLLEGLDQDERNLLEEKYAQGRSVKELATAGHCTEKSIESRLSRIRKKIKRMATK